jgi:Glycine zipper
MHRRIPLALLLLAVAACDRTEGKEVALADTLQIVNDLPADTTLPADSAPASAPVATAATPEPVAKPAAKPAAAPATPPLSPAEAADIAEKTSKLGIFMYAAKGQSKDQQALDQKACYTWAGSQTGIDPATISVNADSAAAAGKAAADEATAGAGIKGAARGAAGGAVVGAIAGDAGTGAGVGAAVGAARGRKAKKQAGAQAEQQAVAQAEGQAAGKTATFKNAMTACLEGKGYTVK